MSEVMQSYAKAERDGFGRPVRKRDTFLFVTAKPVLSECLIQAIETEFVDVAAVQVPDLAAACEGSKGNVSLIFVDLALFEQLENWVPELMNAHPSALIAMVQTDARRSVPIDEILRSNVVCGVLPMHLKLDIWLSVIRLLLIGGEYIPTAMFRPLASEKIVAQQPAKAPAPPGHFDPRELSGLTERELQILELVARGLQNKVIAASLQLSEHTVKIHLHNIITKLGTSNRTQAAAIFHRSRGGEADGASALTLLPGR
ncbi:response regulator transcription factor [Tianweitania sp.]|uniref:helix-turn-helix transcriptional regulator n=1 Tax=Tianweitania sp. TaxID=2021634 RepID=UPI00289BB45E|nr:response regulator transcription factor [Tianweitania sp.]